MRTSGARAACSGATEGLLDAFGPLRVLDTPIAEIAIAGAAIGAAMMGLRPVAEFQFADYMHPAYDQIVNQAATMRWRSVGALRRARGVPSAVRRRGARRGLPLAERRGAYCHVPGLKVVVPATPADAKGLLKAAIRDDDPVVFFEHKRATGRRREEVGDELDPARRRPRRPGRRDVSIVTYGVGVHLAREAADALAGEGIDVEILDLRTLVPMDREAIARPVQSRPAGSLVLHEANKTMGFGAEIAAFAAEELFIELDAPIVRVAGADCHLPYNGPEEDAIIPGVSRRDRCCIAARGTLDSALND